MPERNVKGQVNLFDEVVYVLVLLMSMKVAVEAGEDEMESKVLILVLEEDLWVGALR